MPEAKPDAEGLSLSRDGPVLIVSIDRPHRRNAVTLAIWRALTEIFRGVADDPTLRAVILTGRGGAFSSGADIGEFDQVRANPDAALTYERQVDACLAAIEDAPLPTIAAISGGCVGGGVALALACDFRIADATAYFQLPPARLGLVYGVPKCRRLAACVGLVNAKRLLFSAQRLTAHEAAAIGLVDRTIHPDVQQAAAGLAETFKDAAPLSIEGMKLILNSLERGDVETRLAELDAAVARADDSEDHREAVRAFAEKRSPGFKRR